MLRLVDGISKYKDYFWKFCIIGLSGVIIQLILTRFFFYLLTVYLSIDGANANTISVFSVIPFTTVWNFFWNIKWVFKK